MATQSDFLRDVLSGNMRDNLATVIDRLAGDKDNLKVNLKDVRFTLRGVKFDINGLVEFKVFHTIPNAHAVAKEVAQKYG
ncbi:MAG TPA: hypothetical protein V6C97_34350 [Oculatellaceae cyanobacterium]